MKLEAIGIGDGVSFRVVNSSDFYQQINTLKGRYRLVVEKYRRSKSQPQLGYLFGCVYPMFLRAAIDAGWEDLTSVSDVDTWCKAMFAGRDIVNRQTGQIMTVPGMKRDMTTTELSAYTNQVRDYAAEYFNTYIPEPGTQIEIAL